MLSKGWILSIGLIFSTVTYPEVIIPAHFYDPTKPILTPPPKPVTPKAPIAVKPAPKIFKGKLNLTMVLCQNEHCIAVINGERYRIGDQVQGLTISSADHYEVKLTGFQYTNQHPLVLKLAETITDSASNIKLLPNNGDK